MPLEPCSTVDIGFIASVSLAHKATSRGAGALGKGKKRQIAVVAVPPTIHLFAPVSSRHYMALPLQAHQSSSSFFGPFFAPNRCGVALRSGTRRGLVYHVRLGFLNTLVLKLFLSN
jgi:hypothetical protein